MRFCIQSAFFCVEESCMVRLLKQLVDIKSTRGGEREIADFVAGYLTRLGFRVDKQPVDEQRFNVLARLEEDPEVLLCTHLDTVAPYIPFRRQGDLIYGRGACDAKGQMAAMLMAAGDLLKQNCRRFGLLFDVGEESTSDGAKMAAKLTPPTKYVIIGEPTQNKCAVGQKGTVVFRADASGKSGHSAYPHLGDSAIHKLIGCVHLWLSLDWGRDKVLGESSLNIGKISGGSAPNVIAASASVEGIFRVSQSTEKIKKQLFLHTGDVIEIKILSQTEPQKLKAVEGFETTVVSFGSDAGYLRPLGEIILFGAGSVQFAHAENEQIRLSDLVHGRKSYVTMVKRLLSC